MSWFFLGHIQYIPATQTFECRACGKSSPRDDGQKYAAHRFIAGHALHWGILTADEQASMRQDAEVAKAMQIPPRHIKDGIEVK